MQTLIKFIKFISSHSFFNSIYVALGGAFLLGLGDACFNTQVCCTVYDAILKIIIVCVLHKVFSPIFVKF